MDGLAYSALFLMSGLSSVWVGGTDANAPPKGGVIAGTSSSPIAPPARSDHLFVVDSGSGLDTGCTFRSGGPLVFSIEVTRSVGETNADGTLKYANSLKANGFLTEFATLTMPAFDVDYDAQPGPGYVAERDRVWFNGENIKDLDPGNSEYLLGSNNVWRSNGFRIPIDKVLFPKSPGRDGSPPTPALNTIRIDIDTANDEEAWCTSIDWAALTFGALSPVVLIHGINSDPEFFERRGFTEALEAKHIVWNKQWPNGNDQRIWLKSTLMFDPDCLGADYEEGRTYQNALKLVNGSEGWFYNEHFPRVDCAPIRYTNSPSLGRIAVELGVDSLHLVAHSKGGLDAREYLAQHYKASEGSFSILSLTTLATPHAGSILTDISVSRYAYLTEFGNVDLSGFPLLLAKVAEESGAPSWGYIDLQTSTLVAFNNKNVRYLPEGITYNAVIGDADFDGSGNINLPPPMVAPSEVADLAEEAPRSLGLHIEPLQLHAVNALYQTLRRVGRIEVRVESRPLLLFPGLVAKVPVILPAGDDEINPNDTLVTQDSGLGKGGFVARVLASGGHTRSLGLKANHASIAARAIADGQPLQSNGVIDWILEAEIKRGDLSQR